MDTADDEDAINRIHFVQETLYGKEMKLSNIDKVQGVIIRLRNNENVEKCHNPDIYSGLWHFFGIM